jgi:hypothetical protein
MHSDARWQAVLSMLPAGFELDLTGRSVVGPGCVKSRALAKCREHHSSKLHFRMHEEHAAPAPGDS